jgi:hypothetical protein
MPESVLPASKLDALLVVVPAVLCTFLGASPKANNAVDKWFTVGANVYAIATSLATLGQLKIDSTELYPEAFTAMAIIVIASILTSACIIVGVFARIRSDSWIVSVSFGFSGLMLVGGLYYFYRLFVVACLEDGSTRVLCQHSQAVVVVVFVGIAAAGLVVVCCIVGYLKKKEKQGKNAYVDAESPMADFGGDSASLVQSPAIAMMARVSAASKATVICGYWFLVDDAMTWGSFNGDNGFWWATGQLVKHLSALANNFD